MQRLGHCWSPPVAAPISHQVAAGDGDGDIVAVGDGDGEILGVGDGDGDMLEVGDGVGETDGVGDGEGGVGCGVGFGDESYSTA